MSVQRLKKSMYVFIQNCSGLWLFVHSSHAAARRCGARVGADGGSVAEGEAVAESRVYTGQLGSYRILLSYCVLIVIQGPRCPTDSPGIIGEKL